MQHAAKLVGITQAATDLGISRHTLRAWVRQRRIAHVRLGRRVLIPSETLDAFVRDNLIPAREDTR